MRTPLMYSASLCRGTPSALFLGGSIPLHWYLQEGAVETTIESSPLTTKHCMSPSYSGVLAVESLQLLNLES